ncbi:MAG: branched-chain amino acid ABC transporter permease [Candidatus Rokubacteria bacterium]|nr:branched-chain amino acid ABC transporter permease [Candidatus Rokubacteria bacterium]MBI3107353.1 branched-chain amino acid ABC transporter permease [Candidatus Rokubacteria bacterium]
MLAQVTANGLSLAGLYALVAVGLTLVFGVMRILNFAHGEFVMIGAYLAYWLFALWGVDPLLSFALVLGLMALLGALVQVTLVTRVLAAPHLNQILLTFGIAVTLQNLALLLWTGDLRAIRVWYASTALNVAGVSLSLGRTVGILIAAVLTVGLYLLLFRTEYGRALRAVAQDPDAALVMGIPIHRVYVLAMAVGAAYAGAAGVVASVSMFTYPLLGFLFGLKAFCVVILGGLGSVFGAVLASLFLGLVESFVGAFIPQGGSWAEAISFIVLLLVLLIRPRGMLGLE